MPTTTFAWGRSRLGEGAAVDYERAMTFVTMAKSLAAKDGVECSVAVLDATLNGARAALLRLLEAGFVPGDAIVRNGIDLERVPGAFWMAAAVG